MLGALRTVVEDRARGPPARQGDDPARRAAAVREDVPADLCRDGREKSSFRRYCRRCARRRRRARRWGHRVCGAGSSARCTSASAARCASSSSAARRRTPRWRVGCARSASRSSRGYGLTETSPILALNRLRKFRDDAAGVPLCNVEVRIAEPGENGVGEIQARGPSVMMGYYRNEEATRAVLQDGWFSTGDLGYIDADGFLHVCGRKKNVIVAANGKNVFPEELEDLVNRIPYVLESVVHGVRQADGDEVIGVIVVPNAEELLKLSQKLGIEVTREWVKEVIEREVRVLNRHLASYKQIRQVRVQDSEFAKTTTQKIKRHLVHQQDTTH
ncbi:MAG: AMP-binding protein [Thermoanaerobaculaceae bacterium]